MKYTCCICGKEYDGFGHNPQGALDSTDNWIDWDPSDRCCDQCNLEVVIPGRIQIMRSGNNQLNQHNTSIKNNEKL